MKKDYKLKISFWENFKFLLFSFFCKDEKINYINKNQNAIAESLDICSILRRLQEIDKLKKIFLSSEQITIFNFSPKPLVNLDSNKEELIDKDYFIPTMSFIRKKKKQSFLLPIEKNKNIIKDLITAWNSLIQKIICEEEKKFNEKIFEIIGKQLKEILEMKDNSMNKSLALIDNKSFKENMKIKIELTEQENPSKNELNQSNSYVIMKK